MEVQVRAIASVLHGKKLAQKLVQMILLLQDLEEQKSRSLDEILSSFFPALLGVCVLYLYTFTEYIITK